jgi:hypothetical protein
MEGKPIISIKDFAGSGKGGIWFNNGFAVNDDNGVSQMTEEFKQTKIFDDTDSGYDCGAISTMTYLKDLEDNLPYTLYLDNAGLFFAKKYLTADIKGGYAIGAATGASLYPDVYQLPSGNLIYTRADYLGLIVRGKCKSGSGTEKIVDSAGRNLGTYGLNSGGGDLTSKVVNLKTGALFTITSVSTTDSTNDTLNFAAGTANSATDEYIALVATKFDLDAGLTLPTFQGQEPTQANWARQIRQFDDYWFITNGNFLALLDSDESTFDNNYKQLPYGHQATCIEVNGDKIVVGTQSVNGGGYILLWDGYSDGWLQIRKTKGVIKSIAPYESGFVYVVGGKIFYTDGYNDTLLGEYSDTYDIGATGSSNVEPYSFNGLAVSGDMIFIACRNFNSNRVFNGVYYWSKSYGWGYQPMLYNTQNYWYADAYAGATCVYAREQDTTRVEIGHGTGVNYISRTGASTSANDSKSFIYLLDLPQNQQIKSVGLNIGIFNKWPRYIPSANQCKVSVVIGDGRKGIVKYMTGGCPSTTTFANPAGATYPGVVGEEVLIMNDENAGERSVIQSIADAGTNNEVWTVSPAWSGTTADNNGNAICYSGFHTETKTISIDNINKEQIFQLKKEFLGNKLFIEVVVHGVATSFSVSILGINIYG